MKELSREINPQHKPLISFNIRNRHGVKTKCGGDDATRPNAPSSVRYAALIHIHHQNSNSRLLLTSHLDHGSKFSIIHGL